MYASDPGEVIQEINNQPDVTKADGTYVLSAVVGEQFDAGSGSSSICTHISGTQVCLTQSLIVTGDTTVTLTQPLTHAFSGTLTDSAGTPIPHLTVILSNSTGTTAQTRTDASGNFSVSAIPGVYSLALGSYGVPFGNFSYYYAGQSYANGSIDLTNTDVVQNLQVATAKITVNVQRSDGTPAPNTFVTGYASEGTTSMYASDPGEAIGPIYYNGETTGSDGTIIESAVVGEHFDAGNNGNSYICASISGTQVCLDAPLTITGDTTVTLTQPLTHAFSGTLTDSAGTPLPDMTVILNNSSGVTDQTRTDASGNFSVSAIPGVYSLALGSYGVPFGDFSYYYAGQPYSQSAIDLTDGDVTQNLQVNTTTVTVVVKDMNGNPVPNAFVQAGDYGAGTTYMYPGDPGETIGQVTNDGEYTNAAGSTTLTAVVGEQFGTGSGGNGQLCTNIFGQQVCLDRALTVQGSTTVIFQQDGATIVTPPAPTNLAVTSPTSASPLLTWGTSFGATSYNVYRDGALLGQATTNAYTDTSALPGTYSYYVTAVNSAGESAPSNTASAQVAIGAPTNLTAPTPTNKAPALTWNSVTNAAYYNIYRNGADIGSSTTTSFIDNNAAQGSNTYSVIAVSLNGIESSPSATITVVYDTTSPTITYTVSPVANSAGWNNTAVTVIFTCSDNGTGVGIASCTAPVTLSTNGNNQTVTGTTVDNAGNTASVTTRSINIDTSVPMVGTPTWSQNPIVAGSTTTLTATATSAANLSPVVVGEYYLGSSDPGQGHGMPLSYGSSTGNLTATLGSNLSPGTYQVNVRAETAAGVWSNTVPTSLVVKPLATAPQVTSPTAYTIGIRQIITPADFTVTTTGTPIVHITESGTLPAGLSFTDNGNGTADFTGMIAANAAGTYHLSITASNSAGSDTKPLILTITNTNSAPTTIFTGTGSDTLSASHGVSSSFVFTATGNGKNFKIFLYSGTLPPAMSFHDNKDGTATFFGTPTMVGTYHFTLEAQNSDGVTYQDFTIVVS
jgi:hypothetical protein